MAKARRDELDGRNTIFLYTIFAARLYYLHRSSRSKRPALNPRYEARETLQAFENPPPPHQERAAAVVGRGHLGFRLGLWSLGVEVEAG